MLIDISLYSLLNIPANYKPVRMEILREVLHANVTEIQLLKRKDKDLRKLFPAKGLHDLVTVRQSFHKAFATVHAGHHRDIVVAF